MGRLSQAPTLERRRRRAGVLPPPHRIEELGVVLGLPELVDEEFGGLEGHVLRFVRHDIETVGETLFCYTSTPDIVIDALKHAPALRYLHRPSNLEDVFLKLTGRDLRD